MPPDPGETTGGSIQLDLGQSQPRQYAQCTRKKPAWVFWLVVCAIPGVVVVLAGLAWWGLSQDTSSLTILPVDDQVIRQGDALRVRIAAGNVLGNLGDPRLGDRSRRRSASGLAGHGPVDTGEAGDLDAAGPMVAVERRRRRNPGNRRTWPLVRLAGVATDLLRLRALAVRTRAPV